MPRPKKNETSESEKLMSMILRLSLDQHSWVKSISEATDLAHPKVVTLILDEAMKNDPDAYINQVKKSQAERRLKEIEQREHELSLEKKKIKDQLN